MSAIGSRISLRVNAETIFLMSGKWSERKALTDEAKEMQGQFDFELTNQERWLLGLLQTGRQNARSVSLLSELTGLKDVEVRQIVRHLIMDHNCLIASSVGSPAGFYIAESPEEIQAATKSLRHRGISILMRAAKLQKISIEDVFKQSRIEFKEAGK